MNSSFSKAVLTTFYESGLIVDSIEKDGDYEVIKISVPETSFESNAFGEDIAGLYLAKQFKDLIFKGNMIFKYKIRKGDHWTKEKAEKARQEIAERIDKIYFGI